MDGASKLPRYLPHIVIGHEKLLLRAPQKVCQLKAFGHLLSVE
jgi:hypothetical protein